MNRLVLHVRSDFAKADQAGLFGPIQTNPDLEKKKVVTKRGHVTTRYVKKPDTVLDQDHHKELRRTLDPHAMLARIRGAAEHAHDDDAHHAYWQGHAQPAGETTGETTAVKDPAPDVPTVLRWKVDNPATRDPGPDTRAWLERNPKTVTAFFTGKMPVAELMALPGARNEHEHIEQPNVDRLTASMRADGYDAGAPISVQVMADGRPLLWEGNHRTRAAHAMGYEVVPVEVKFEGGSESREGVWMPSTLRDHLAQQDATPAPQPEPEPEAAEPVDHFARHAAHQREAEEKKRQRAAATTAITDARWNRDDVGPTVENLVAALSSGRLDLHRVAALPAFASGDALRAELEGLLDAAGRGLIGQDDLAMHFNAQARRQEKGEPIAPPAAPAGEGDLEAQLAARGMNLETAKSLVLIERINLPEATKGAPFERDVALLATEALLASLGMDDVQVKEVMRHGRIEGYRTLHNVASDKLGDLKAAVAATVPEDAPPAPAATPEPTPAPAAPPEPVEEAAEADEPVDDFPIPVTPEDVPLKRAIAAHAGTSHSPERRGRARQAEYMDHLRGMWADLRKGIKSPEQEAVARDEFERYRDGLLKRYLAMLDAQSRVMSPMIAGPANFPARQNEKRGATADKRSQELNEYTEKARRGAFKRLWEAAPSEVVQSEEAARLKRAAARDMRVVAGIDAGTEPYTRSAFVNSIAGKLQRSAKNGGEELAAAQETLRWIEEQQKAMPKPLFTKRHKVWKILDMEPAKPEPAREAEELEGAHADMTLNHERGGVELTFPGKPSDDVRARLKGAGFRWSGRQGLWYARQSPKTLDLARAVAGVEEQ